MTETYPTLIATVLDAVDCRGLAEFYRQLLGYGYRPGDEVPPSGAPDPKGADWLVLVDGAGEPRLAIQQVDELPAPTWPESGVAQQLHLDLGVGDSEQFELHCERALELGASLLHDRSDDPDEQLRVFADPAGHPFCILVAPRLA